LEISGIYEQLWKDAALLFERGEVKADPYLSTGAEDLRRGVTLVFRPSATVRKSAMDYIRRLAAIWPEQYFYGPEQLHVTVLSIVTVTERWQQEMERVKACRPLIGEALDRQHSFRVSFRGVTAAPDGVMIQGFPAHDGLRSIREVLREAFRDAGFGDMPDRRYKATAAHMSVMRVRKPGGAAERLVSFLKESRERDFGECQIASFELIWSDWYASAGSVKTLEKYRLLT
jgi:2'-5' RNA ligase